MDLRKLGVLIEPGLLLLERFNYLPLFDWRVAPYIVSKDAVRGNDQIVWVAGSRLTLSIALPRLKMGLTFWLPERLFIPEPFNILVHRFGVPAVTLNIRGLFIM